MPDNPFIPSFGVSPLYLAGRDAALDEVRQVSLNLARVDYSRASLIIGQRGIGKTVLLNAVEDAAREDDWLMVQATAAKGFLGRLVVEQLLPLLAELKPDHAKVTGELSVGIGVATAGITIEGAEQSPTVASFRNTVFAICEAAPERGLLFTIDEINTRARDELEEFATVYQHAIREGLNVALVMCGIPASLSPMLSKDAAALTFLNRANRVDIDLLPLHVAKTAFRETIAIRGTRTATEETIDFMARTAKGYPFAIQEVGNRAWDVNPEAREITLADAEAVRDAAIQAMYDSVLRPIWRALPDRMRDILRVLARDPEIRTSAMAKEIGATATAMGGLYQRLIETGVAVRAERGRVAITIPYLAAYVRSLDVADDEGRDRLAILDEYDD
ncbi:hypothetical protein GCM10025867_46210 (plasmid) [Frondihabitans sucicola]|uniref:Orc1-like AAA ATPase domain-containing protein n=1 Tax=Frondihabitans sucicola TaxID=1268041 RepID=A0ABM8GV88_9MICO|nr:AAA family ATPase [Frondihabitans sucicola]BDZ52380.1 hypothetical protein GCM10025867_46210 [Frondihabitans sucicola]